MKLNPWLTEKVLEYRNQHDDSVLRADYDLSAQTGSKLSWDQHLAVRALQSAFKGDPFLQTIRLKVDLPLEILDALYRCHVDCVADLMQLSEEELEECARTHKFELAPVRKYLRKHGYKLKRCNERTCKVQSLLLLPTLTAIAYKTWVLHPPGSIVEFDLTRPISFRGQWWEEEYYSQYEHIEGEDELETVLKGVKPALTGDLPYDYQEFFSTLRTFFQCYGTICTAENLGRCHFLMYDLPTKSSELAFIDNGELLFTKKTYVSALISIFERTNLFKYYTPGQFLAASDEGKLTIAERESGNDTFQLLLVTYVELRIDFENLLTYLKELAKMPVFSVPDDQPQPLTPLLGKAIVEYRKRHTDEELREEYRRFTCHTPGKSWRDFLIDCALVEGGIPETGVEGIRIGKERLAEALEAARKRANDAIEKRDELLRTRLERAVAILSAADRAATASDCDIRLREQILRDYAVLLEANMLNFPDLAKDAPAVAERLLSTMQAAYGAESLQTVGGKRLNGSVQSKLGHHQEAAAYYIAAADMMVRISGPDTLWRGKDLRSAAICSMRIPEYDKALVLFFQAVTVFKQHPDEPHELEETYLGIAECYRLLKDGENEQKYRLLASNIHNQDE